MPKETIAELADRNGISPAKLVALNTHKNGTLGQGLMKNPNGSDELWLVAGQNMKLPGDAPATPPSSNVWNGHDAIWQQAHWGTTLGQIRHPAIRKIMAVFRNSMLNGPSHMPELRNLFRQLTGGKSPRSRANSIPNRNTVPTTGSLSTTPGRKSCRALPGLEASDRNAKPKI